MLDTPCTCGATWTCRAHGEARLTFDASSRAFQDAKYLDGLPTTSGPRPPRASPTGTCHDTWGCNAHGEPRLAFDACRVVPFKFNGMAHVRLAPQGRRARYLRCNICTGQMQGGRRTGSRALHSSRQVVPFKLEMPTTSASRKACTRSQNSCCVAR